MDGVCEHHATNVDNRSADRSNILQLLCSIGLIKFRTCLRFVPSVQPGVEMNAGFTAALAGLSEAPLNWERCSQVNDWVRTRAFYKQHH